MVYPPTQYTQTPTDQVSQLKKIYDAAVAKGIPHQQIVSAFNQYQSAIRSQSQNNSNAFTNPINHQGGYNAIGSPGEFGADTPASPIVPVVPTPINPITPITPVQTPNIVPTYDTTQINANASQDIADLGTMEQQSLDALMQQRAQVVGGYDIQKNALLDKFQNGQIISDRIDTINTLLSQGQNEDQIAQQLGFTKDQLYKYAQGNYFDAQLKPAAAATITENYDQQLARNEQDAAIARQRIKTNLDNLNVDYTTEQDRLKQELATQEANMSKLLGINGAGFSSSGLRGLELMNQQGINLLKDMSTQHARNTDTLNNQMQDLGITLVRATEDINKKARDAIQTGANSAMALIQKIKTEIGTANVDAVVKIQEVEAKFAGLIQDRRDQQVKETSDLQTAIKAQYDAIKANQAEQEKQYVSELENVKTYGANMTLQDIIGKAQSGQLSAEYAKLAVSQLISSTVKTLDDASGGLFGTQNSEQIKKLLGQGNTPNQIIQQFAGQFQTQTEAPEVKNFGTAKRPNYKQWNGTERVPVPGQGFGGGGGGSGGGGGMGGTGNAGMGGIDMSNVAEGDKKLVSLLEQYRQKLGSNTYVGLQGNSTEQALLNNLIAQITAEYKQAKKLGTLDAGVQTLINNALGKGGSWRSLTNYSLSAQSSAVKQFIESMGGVVNDIAPEAPTPPQTGGVPSGGSTGGGQSAQDIVNSLYQ